MDFMFDSADIALINEYKDMFDYVGVTSNPALIRKAGLTSGMFDRFREIRSIIGFDRSLHMQVVSHDYKEMIREALHIIEQVDDKVFIKVPVTPDGMKCMKYLKSQGIGITATAVVTQMQAIMALSLDVDFIAPYYDQMCDIGINGNELISMLVDTIDREEKKTKILAANIKNMAQLRDCMMSGAQCITLNPQLLEESLRMPQIAKAVKFFDDAWDEMYGTTSICDLK